MKTDSNNQQWIQWKPSSLNLDGNYNTSQVIDTPDCFKILITKVTELQLIEITFNTSVWAYRRTSESFRQNIFKELSLTYGNDFYINWSFFKITEGSSYLKWLDTESCGISDELNLTHYVIMTLDDIFDVVANYEPEIKITKCARRESNLRPTD